MTSPSIGARLRLVVVASMIVAGMALAPSVTSASAQKAFHLTKTCSSDLLCTVVTDDFKAIPAGTEITYEWASAVVSYPTITVRNGTSTGICDWDQPTGPVLAKCTFGAGTGRLTQFHLAVDVTTLDYVTWLWDGSYWFGGD